MLIELKLLPSHCLLKSQFTIQKESTFRDLHCATHYSSLMWTTTLLQQFHLFVISFKWTMAVMLHSVNDNVNNNKEHFIFSSWAN